MCLHVCLPPAAVINNLCLRNLVNFTLVIATGWSLPPTSVQMTTQLLGSSLICIFIPMLITAYIAYIYMYIYANILA